jgi:hypothetical protein
VAAGEAPRDDGDCLRATKEAAALDRDDEVKTAQEKKGRW